MNEGLKKTLNTALPVLLGAFVLYWMYRDFDFAHTAELLRSQTDWCWMAASLFFGIMSHVLRGWRWMLALEPLDEHPKAANCVDAIFVSYAANLVVPRVGELSRCAVLKRCDGVSFSKSLGTVVTERVIDALCTLALAGLAVALQMPLFARFFSETGIKVTDYLHLLSSPWFYVCLLCLCASMYVLWRLARFLRLSKQVGQMFAKLLAGAMSLRRVRNVPLYVAYSAGIWLCYFLHFYLTFFCFPFTQHLGAVAGLVLFVGGTFAVIVPTPNGAGPWHFAVITMMMLYGVSADDSAAFALIVHTVQTLLVIVLGVWGWLAAHWRQHLVRG